MGASHRVLRLAEFRAGPGDGRPELAAVVQPALVRPGPAPLLEVAQHEDRVAFGEMHRVRARHDLVPRLVPVQLEVLLHDDDAGRLQVEVAPHLEQLTLRDAGDDRCLPAGRRAEGRGTAGVRDEARRAVLAFAVAVDHVGQDREVFVVELHRLAIRCRRQLRQAGGDDERRAADRRAVGRRGWRVVRHRRDGAVRRGDRGRVRRHR